MQSWREVAAQVVLLTGEQEMTKVFLKTLGLFDYERIVASTPSDVTKMLSMGVHLEEVIWEGRFSKEEGSSETNKSSYGFSKNKES